MTVDQIFDEVMKYVLGVPQNVTYSETIKAQAKAIKDSKDLLTKELGIIYNKGYEDGVKFQQNQQLKKQQKEN